MAEIRKTLIPLVAVLAVSHMHAADFRRGMLLVCEGQFGADYGSLAFFGEDGSRMYRVFSEVNPGYYLGTTSQSGCCRNDNVYVVSKDAAGGGFITVMEASTLQYKGSLNSLPGHCQAFYLSAVSEEKGYLSTSEGLYVIDLAGMVVTARVSGAGLSSGMFGQSLCLHDRLYAISRRDGVVVVNIHTDEVEKVIPVQGASAIASSSAEGMIYIGTTNSSGEIVKISADDFSVEKIDLPGGDAALTEVWESWHLQPFAFDCGNNALLITGKSPEKVNRYELHTGEFISGFIKLPETSRGYAGVVYGQGISVSPYDGSVTIIAAHSAGDVFNDDFRIYSADASTGELIPDRTIEMPDEYWFPAQILYPASISSIHETKPDENEHGYRGPVYTPMGIEVFNNADIEAVRKLPAGIYIFANRKIAVK